MQVALALGIWLLLSCSGRANSDQTKQSDPTSIPNKQNSASPTQPAGEEIPTVVLLAPGRESISVKVEIARTAEQRNRGLMFRKHLDPDAGMLFIFEGEQALTFWMRNTYIPLDMMFIDANKRVVGVVENTEPLTDTPRRVNAKAQYVLEVNAGFSAEHGIGPGTLVRF